MKAKMLSCLVVCLLVNPLLFSAEAEPGVAITVYNDNFAVVKESRSMAFEKGVNTFKFTDVAERIDPTSVNFLCVTAPDAVSILEQNYEYDLVNTASLLKRFIDKDVYLKVRGTGAGTGTLENGKLLSAMGRDIILQNQDGGLRIIGQDSIEQVLLEKAPTDLVTKPTLVWLVDSAGKGDQLCRVTYTTDGIGWKADYSAVLSDDEKTLDLSGWVTIDNKSGAAYKDAAIKLIAGDVNRIKPVQRHPEMMMMDSRLGMAKASAPAFEEKAFMEYHLYTLGRKSTVLNNQVKQIELITPARNVPVEKKYIAEVSINEWQIKHKDKVQVKIEFENKKEHQLGIALPKGKVRVFKKDPADESLEFVGEDQIDHTPRKEKLSLYIGDAFDIVPEQKITDSKRGDGFISFTRRVELRNRKDEAVTVYVDELIPYRRNWQLNNQTHSHEKIDAETVRFPVKIAADKTAVLEYRMTQTW